MPNEPGYTWLLVHVGVPYVGETQPVTEEITSRKVNQQKGFVGPGRILSVQPSNLVFRSNK